MTKLLVASGVSREGNVKNVEVINLDEENPNLICDNLPDLPSPAKDFYYATGQLLMEKSPTICGRVHGKCICQILQNGSWNLTPDPKECRNQAASAILTNSEEEKILIVAGGFFAEKYFDSVESFDGMSWNSQQIASLPKPIYGHCIVKVNSSTLLSIGGSAKLELAIKNTYFYNAIGNQWTPGVNFISVL